MFSLLRVERQKKGGGGGGCPSGSGGGFLLLRWPERFIQMVSPSSSDVHVASQNFGSERNLCVSGMEPRKFSFDVLVSAKQGRK